MPYRPIVLATEECPLHIIISLENCKKCTYNEGIEVELGRSGVSCGLESEFEKKMKPETSTTKEYKNKW